MRRKALQVISNADPRRSSRMESRQPPILERDVVVETHKLHEHIADQQHKILDIACLVARRHILDRGFGRASTFGRRALARR